MLKAYGKVWEDGDVSIVFASSIEKAAHSLDVLGDPIESGIYEINEDEIDGMIFNFQETVDEDGDDIVECALIEDIVSIEDIQSGIMNGNFIPLTIGDLFPDADNLSVEGQKKISSLLGVSVVSKIPEPVEIPLNLNRFCNDDYQRRGSEYPKSDIPVSINYVKINELRQKLVFSFKNTTEEVAKNYVKRFCQKESLNPTEINCEQTGDFANDWVDVTAIF